MVRPQPGRSAGGQLPRRSLVRPRGKPVVRGHSLRARIPHRPERRMGARRSVRRLAERAEDPQGRLDFHRRLQARPDAARRGRVYRLRANGELQHLVDNAPSPNGITLNKTNTHVYVAITRSQQIWRLPLMAGGTLSKSGVAIQLSGGHAGPDGIEADDEEGLAVCHLGVGVWRFDSNCLPTHLVDAGKENRLMTNIAYGG
ncbi:MAG: SMP-30/gluconolactonase/LRE family protein, partial [Betaproteobacteria bacterium]